MTNETPANRRQGRRLQPYFVATCVDLRAKAGASEERIADLLGRKTSAVTRFERGETWPAAELELYAAAYAAVADIDDPRDVYTLSIDTWRKDGRMPLTAPQLRALGPDADGEFQPEISFPDLVAAIRKAGENARANAEAASRPTSTRRKRAGRG